MTRVNWRLLVKSILGCAVGAWIGGILTFWLQGVLFGPARADGSVIPDFSLWHYVSVSHYIAILAFIPTAILGLPGQRILQHFHITSILPIVAFAALLGALAFPIVNVVLDTMSDWQGAVLGGLGGFFIASIDWLIRRPDLDDKALPSPETHF